MAKLKEIKVNELIGKEIAIQIATKTYLNEILDAFEEAGAQVDKDMYREPIKDYGREVAIRLAETSNKKGRAKYANAEFYKQKGYEVLKAEDIKVVV